MLNDSQLQTLILDIIQAEAMPLPGFARQQWVIANQLRRATHSDPPLWVWLLIALLEKVIPMLLDYLKQRFGPDWPSKTLDTLKGRTLPWL